MAKVGTEERYMTPYEKKDNKINLCQMISVALSKSLVICFDGYRTHTLNSLWESRYGGLEISFFID